MFKLRTPTGVNICSQVQSWKLAHSAASYTVTHLPSLRRPALSALLSSTLCLRPRISTGKRKSSGGNAGTAETCREIPVETEVKIIERVE